MRKQPIARWAGAGFALLVAGLWSGAALAQASGRSSPGVPWLGIYTQDVGEDSELRETLELQGDGALVTRVATGSPAAKAGIQRRDFIVRFNNRDVESATALTELVRACRVGQSVAVVVLRDGTRRTLNVTLGARPESFGEDATPEARERRIVIRDKDEDGDHEIVIPDVDGESFHMLEPGKDGFQFLTRLNPRGRLGVRVEDLNADLAEALGVRGGKGALVLEVMDGTPAQKAGIKGGDVITGVADEAVDDTEDLVTALRDREGSVRISLVRKGQNQSLTATLEKKPQPMSVRLPRMERQDLRRLRDQVRGELGRGPEAMSRGEVEEELRKLREELRQLREKLEALDR